MTTQSALDPFSLLPLLREILGANAASIYLVGGAVRDMVMGQRPDDFDFVVLGRFDSTLSNLFELAPQLSPHGIVVLREEHLPNISLFSMFVRNAEGTHFSKFDFSSVTSEFGALRLSKEEQPFPEGSIEYDLSRRDFTINSMAIPLASPYIESVIAPFSSFEDLNNKILRALTLSLFDRDPESILRAFYYRERFGLIFEPETEKTLLSAVQNKRLANRARTGRRTLIKIFSKSLAAKVVPTLIEQGILSQLIPQIDPPPEYLSGLKKTYELISSGVLPHVGTETEFMFGFSVLFGSTQDKLFDAAISEFKLNSQLKQSFLRSRTLLKEHGVL